MQQDLFGNEVKSKVKEGLTKISSDKEEIFDEDYNQFDEEDDE